jgi:hypothetical protein
LGTSHETLNLDGAAVESSMGTLNLGLDAEDTEHPDRLGLHDRGLKDRSPCRAEAGVPSGEEGAR